MDNLKKALTTLDRVSTSTNLLNYADRVELKRQRSGHYRLYIACIPNTPLAAEKGTQEAATPDGFTANPYRKGGFLTSVSFADDTEPQGRK